MAEYFSTRGDAERFIQEWYAKDGKSPAFFGKIFNNGTEKWIVNYDARHDPWASPHIKVLEDHSKEIRSLVTAPQTKSLSQPICINYYVSRQGQHFGPYTVAQIHQFVAENRLLLSDFAWAAGAWIPLAQLLSQPPFAEGAPVTRSFPETSAIVREDMARTALMYVSNTVSPQRRKYITSRLLGIKEGEDPLAEMCAAALCDQTDLLQFLIETCRGNVNHKNDKGRTPLHSAARQGYPDTVRLFLKYSPDVNARDHDGMTPLMCCAETGRELISYTENGRNMFGPYGKQEGHIETIRVLIRAGADVNSRNHKGATAADIATEKKFMEIVAALTVDVANAPS